MKIICDIDNVLVDWQSSWIDKYQHDFNRRVPWSTRGRWDCYATGTHFDNYTEFSTWLGDAFWWEINDRPIPAAAFRLRDAVDRGHDVLLATHRPEGAPMYAATDFARRLCLPVVFAAPLEKAELDGDVWIDDAPELLWDLKRRGKQGIRFVCPWNEGAPGIPMVDWSEFTAIIKGLGK